MPRRSPEGRVKGPRPRNLRSVFLPHVTADDAMHVALSAYYQMDFLLTWNCRHIANAEKKPLIRCVCEGWGCACHQILESKKQELFWKSA